MRFWLTCTLFFTQLLADAPSWYGSLPNANPYVIIGYGEGKSFEEAKINAKNDIAKTIASQINSSFEIQTSLKNGDVNHKAQENISETTQLSLFDVKIIEKAVIAGDFFVALSYENLPLSSKLVQVGGKALCGEPHPYLLQTPIFKNISRELNCSVGAQVTRDNNQWYLGHNQYRSIIKRSDLHELMIETSKKGLHVRASRSEVKENESYSLQIDGIQNHGYLSLFDLYDDGRVVVVEKNIDLSKLHKNAVIYPDDFKKDLELSGGVLEAGKDTLDLYVVLISDEPLKLSSFLLMGQNIEKSEIAFAFDKLLSLMQENSFATTVVTNRALKK